MGRRARADVTPRGAEVAGLQELDAAACPYHLRGAVRGRVDHDQLVDAALGVELVEHALDRGAAIEGEQDGADAGSRGADTAAQTTHRSE